MEQLDHVQLLAGTHKLDGLAGGRPDGQGRAAPGVTVQLGQHHAVDAQGIVEGGGGVHRVLAGHGVHHQQDLIGVDGGLNVLQLVHELLVDMEAARRVQQDRVKSVVLGVGQGVPGDLHRVDLPLGKHGDPQLFSHHLELGDGGGAVYVAGRQQRPFAHAVFEIARQLGAVGGLAGALEAHHHDHCGSGVGKGDLGVGAAHHLRQFFVDDLDDLLGGGQALQHIAAGDPLRHRGHKVLHHFIADVRLQQGHADLPHGLLHVGLRQPPLAPQALKGGAQFFRQALKCHSVNLLIPSTRPPRR